MKTSLFIILIGLLTLNVHAQEKRPVFSNMEKNHIRVATPGLFDKSKSIHIHLDSLAATDYSFPLPGGKVISPYGRGGGRHTGVDIKTLPTTPSVALSMALCVCRNPTVPMATSS